MNSDSGKHRKILCLIQTLRGFILPIALNPPIQAVTCC